MWGQHSPFLETARAENPEEQPLPHYFCMGQVGGGRGKVTSRRQRKDREGKCGSPAFSRKGGDTISALGALTVAEGVHRDNLDDQGPLFDILGNL